MKKTYLTQVSSDFKLKRQHDNDIKKCNEDLIKKHKLFKSKKFIIQRK